MEDEVVVTSERVVGTVDRVDTKTAFGSADKVAATLVTGSVSE